MEFSAGIMFNGNPMENKELTITYSGYLFQNNSSALTIVYGFGDNWMYTNEQKMEKTENGFVANIKMLNFSKFNFCFKNENNAWDNNYNSNFTAPISEFKVDDEAFVLNENVVEEIITNIVKYDVSEATGNGIEVSQEDNSFEVFEEKNENIDIAETIVNVITESNLNEDLNQVFSEYYENENVLETNNVVDPIEVGEQKFDINEFAELFEGVEAKVSDNSAVDNVVDDMIDNLYEDSKNREIAQGFQPSYFSMDISKIYRYGQETGLVVSPRASNPFTRMKTALYKFFYSIPKLFGRAYDEER